MRAGDVVLLQSSGGGGYGDPLERDVSAVARDVGDGVVSRPKAGSVYGVVFRDGQVDEEATQRRRQEIRATRPRVRLKGLAGPPYRDGRRVCRLSRPAAERSGIREGAIVEFVNWMGAPLRAWVDGITDDEGHVAWLAPDALPLLAGDEVEIRTVRVPPIGGFRALS